MIAHTIGARSVTLRATVAIVAFSSVVGASFAIISVPVMQQRERERLEARVAELASTVSSTVSIAAYVRDKTLANEVANGLLTNRSVSSVAILADGELLAARSKGTATLQRNERAAQIVRPIASPFDATSTVGELRIVPAAAEIRDEAAAYARYLSLILALQAAALAAVVARVVLRTVVQPIKSISDDLHRLRADRGEQLSLPEGNERNEIGRLARDVNALIEKQMGLLSSERQLREQRERSERRLRLIIENAETGIFTIDSAARLISWNPAFARKLGLSPTSSAGAAMPPLTELLAPHSEQVRRLIAEATKSAHSESLDFELDGAAGAKRWLNVLLQPIESAQLQGLISDVTEHKQAAQNALALAEHDHLTGLANRLGLERAAAPLLAQAHAGRRPTVALMMLDLDWFKQVNDMHGHEAGDEVLQAIAGRLRRSVRPEDIVARLGGDEFVLVLDQMDSPATARSMGERLIDSISEPIALANGVQVRVGASIGVAFAQGEHATLERLMRSADAAMYEAKQSGRSRCKVCDSLPALAIA